MRRAWLVVLALVFLMGEASAAPLSGSVDFRESALAGRATLDSDQGVLDLAPTASVRPVAISWTHAVGNAVTARSERFSVGNYTPVSGDPLNDSVEYGPGSLDDLGCARRCELVLLALGDDGRVGIEGAADGSLGRVTTPIIYAAGSLGSPLKAPDAAFHYVVPRGWLAAGGSDAREGLSLQNGNATGSGTLYLFAYGAEGNLTHDRERAPFWTGSRNVSQREVAGAVVSRTVETRFVVLRLEGARLQDADASRARLYAPTARVRVDGTWTASAAHGQVRAGPKTTTLDGETVSAVGAPVVDYATDASSRPSATLSGDAETLFVDGIAVHQDATPIPKAAAEGVLVLTVVLLALAGLRAAGWLPAYSRIQREDILDNENRRRLLALVHERPGIVVTELATRLGVTEAVIRYHLRMLRRAKLVTIREIGRVTASYPVASSCDEARARAVAALRGRTREALAARLLGSASGATQRDLAETTKTSQRLVAYHLAEMSRVGLVAGDEGRPQLYVATPLLREFARSVGKDPA